MRKTVLVLLAGSCLLVRSAVSAVADVKSDVAAYIGQASAGEKSESMEDAVSKAPPGQVLAALRQHLLAPKERVRLEAASLIARIGMKASERPIKRQATRMLLDVVLEDPDSGLASSARGSLMLFERADFTDDMRQVLHSYLLSRKDTPGAVYSEMALAGTMHIPAATGLLRQFAAANPRADSPANLALARMGDQQATQRIIAKVEGEPNLTRRVTRLLSEYSYVRQPQTVEQLVRYLFSDERLPLYGVPNTGERVATRAVTELRGIIVGFPDRLYPTAEEEIAEARKWVVAQGGAANLKIKR